jgi:hypothetical protein
MVDVPPGRLYLGETIDPSEHRRTGDPVLLGASQLTTHGVIVGMTGSGKTGLGMVLIEEALLAGVPVLVLDPKGDMGNLMLTFPDLDAASFEPWVPQSEVDKAGVPRPDHAAAVATTWKDGLAGWGIDGTRIRALRERADVTIYTPGSTVGVPIDLIGNLRAPTAGGEPELVNDEIEGLVSSLLDLVGVESDPLSGREHILLTNLVHHAWGQGLDLDVASLIAQVQDPPMRKLGVIDVETFFPSKDRIALAMLLNGLVASPSFAAWTQGVPLDIDAMLHGAGGRPRAAIVQLSHLSDEERQFVVTVVLSKLVTWMRRQPGTTDLRAMLYMDEVAGYLPPTANPPTKQPIMTLMKQARAFGLGVVLSTQNPVDIDYKAISNAGTWMIGRLQTERDKARLVEGLRDAAGATDVASVGDMIGALAKREFVLRSASSDTTTVFTSRWAMSYLPGPLSREQTGALMAGASTAAVTPAAAPAVAAPATPAAPAADDETTVAPSVADGIASYHLDPAAPWAATVGAVPGGMRLEAGLVARCRLLFDDAKADLREEQEWEAVVFPLDGPVRGDDAVAVDYDARDLRGDAPSGARYVLPGADIGRAAYFTSARKALLDHLARSQSLDILTNRELKLFSRPGETADEFARRCAEVADQMADAETDKIRDALAKRSDRVREAIAKAEDRVREVESDRKRRGLDAVVSVGGGILGTLLGGKKNTKSILSTIGRASSKGGMTTAANQRLESARNRLAEGKIDLEEIEAELADALREIADKWDAKAAAVETVAVPLEKSDVTVEEIAVVWVPRP